MCINSPEESIPFPEQELLHQNNRATNLNYELLRITFSNIFIQSPWLYLELQMTKELELLIIFYISILFSN